MAKNIEVLRNYFLGKDPQLKETMADNSLRLIGIEGKHFVLRTEVIARLEDLRKYIDDEDEELQDAIERVIRDLSAESAARQSQDRNLSNRITDEVLARQSSVSNLQNNINTEKTQRMQADQTLNNRVTSLESWKTNTDFVLDEDLIAALGNYYTKPEVNQLISVIPRFDIEVVQSLPTQDISETTIYLVPSTDPQTRNFYDEFIYVSNAWEQIGSTAIDLSNYYNKSETDDLLGEKQNTLTAGTGIDITNNTISSTVDGIQTISSGTVSYSTLADGIYKIDNNAQVNIGETIALGQITVRAGYLLIHRFSNQINYEHISDYNGGALRRILTVGYVPDPAIVPGMNRYTEYDLSKFETNENKVTSISSSSTNTQYPSAKLLYDQLLLKYNITDGDLIHEITNSISMDDLDEGIYYIAGDVYYTSNDYIEPGTDNFLLIVNDSLEYTVLGLDGSIKYGIYGNPINELNLNDFEDSSNKVTSISSGSTNIQYPSAKLLYDQLQLKQDTLTAGTNITIDANNVISATGGGSNITYGTQDMTPGVTPLSEGEFYFQYE